VSDRYKNGAITYLDVVVAQTTALTNERDAVSISRRRMAASAALTKALGGGWDASTLPTDEQIVQSRSTRARYRSARITPGCRLKNLAAGDGRRYF
jgi:hypothetical protein